MSQHRLHHLDIRNHSTEEASSLPQDPNTLQRLCTQALEGQQRACTQAHYCDNCGVFMTGSDAAICSRCLNLPHCTICKRHLQPSCFDEPHCCQSCVQRKAKPPHITSAVGRIITELQMPIGEDDTTFDIFIANNAERISGIVQDLQQRHESIRVVARTVAEFSRQIDQDVQHVRAYFSSQPQLVTAAHVFDVEQLSSEMNLAVEAFNTRGSNFLFDRISEFTLVITEYRPLAGSTYVPTPPTIERKKAIVNVKNVNDRCFELAILSALYPSKNNPAKVCSYSKYMNTLNFDNIPFPVSLKDICKFEKQNPEISVNVISPENNGFSIDYLSPEWQRRHHVNLLLLHDANNGTKHYTWIKNFSRLLGERSNHGHASYVCNSCLNVFSSQRILDEHIPNCLRHNPQMINYPNPSDPNECKLKFKDYQKQHQVGFYLVCDFEAFLVPDDNHSDPTAKTRVIDRHEISGFCCHRMTDAAQHQTEPTVYSGPDVMTHFYNHIMSENEAITQILSHQAPMTPMTDDDVRSHRAASTCYNCKSSFSHDNFKVRHHDHLSGRYLFPCCNACNLQLKPKKGKDDKYILPVIFHNGSKYDSHYCIKHFAKEYTQKTNSKGTKTTYDDVKIIPLNAEQFLQFQIGSIKFLDSLQFLSTSLENLVSLLFKAGKQNFHNTVRYLGDSDLVFGKGVFPYSFMTDRSKFQETQLPPIESFFNSLNDEAPPPQDYERAQAIWKFFNITNMQQFHDHYLLSDVLLLADVFEHFRQDVLEKHGLDCLHYPTLPSLSWSIALKCTGVELDLITDPVMYLMVENSICGGISTITTRYSKANNPLLDDYDSSKETTYITYLDQNNLYGLAMSQPLPVGNFKFLSRHEIDALDIMSIAEDAPTGYIIDCDIEYPAHLHDAHSDYPLAPEHITVTSEMLSPFAASLTGKGWKPAQKLIPNLFNKTNYVTHYRNLQFYLKHGFILTKVHRILSFTQSAWLKPWIEFCTTQRQNAKSEFEADLAKLQANATFGKIMEQVRNRENIRLIADSAKLRKAVSKPSYRQARIINPDLVMVRATRQKITLNKPIAVGFSVLELSKLSMYEFYYDYLKSKYQSRCKLLFTDTDSLCCEIQTPDVRVA